MKINVTITIKPKDGLTFDPDFLRESGIQQELEEIVACEVHSLHHAIPVSFQRFFDITTAHTVEKDTQAGD